MIPKELARFACERIGFSLPNTIELLQSQILHDRGQILVVYLEDNLKGIAGLGKDVGGGVSTTYSLSCAALKPHVPPHLCQNVLGIQPSMLQETRPFGNSGLLFSATGSMTLQLGNSEFRFVCILREIGNHRHLVMHFYRVL